MHHIRLSFLLPTAVWLLYACPAAPAATVTVSAVAALTSCAQAASPNRCEVMPGVYPIPPPGIIVTPGTTIVGVGTSPYSVILRRSSPSPYPILTLTGFNQPGSPNSNMIFVENVTMDGNRWIFPIFPQWGLAGCTPPNYGCGPPSMPGVCLADIDSYNGKAGIQNVWFNNAPGNGLKLGNGWVSGGIFILARSTGVELFGFGSAYFSSFQGNGTAGITVRGPDKFGQAGNSYVWGNYLWSNRFEMSDMIGGGQIVTEPVSENSVVAENIIDGNYWYTSPGQTVNGCYVASTHQYASGIEHFSLNCPTPLCNKGNHRFYNNEITKQSAVGFFAGGTNGTIISGPNPLCPGCAPKYIKLNGVGYNPGINILSTAEHGNNFNLTLDGIRSVTNSGEGVRVDHQTHGPGYINGACLSAPFPWQPYYPTNAPFPFQNPGGTPGNPIPGSAPCPP